MLRGRIRAQPLSAGACGGGVLPALSPAIHVAGFFATAAFVPFGPFDTFFAVAPALRRLGPRPLAFAPSEIQEFAEAARGEALPISENARR